jgi:hypothetical protein
VSVNSFLIQIKLIDLHIQGKYNEWCAKTGFTSKLPNAVKHAKIMATNGLLTDHFGPAAAKAENIVPPYFEEAFMHLAVEWMVATDQVSFCLVLHHPPV